MKEEGALPHHSQFDFFDPIEKAYEWSSQQLLELVFGECQLIKRLESIKHYFFLDKGDFFLHFVEGSEDILETQTNHITIEKMESYLEMAIRTSSANSDPFKDDVTCSLSPFGLIEQLIAIRNIRGALG
jgi:gamma-tubulin complex component 2